jgi:hypothetical protein
MAETELAAEAPVVTEPGQAVPAQGLEDLGALRDLAVSQAELVGYTGGERLAVLDMWVTGTLADMGALFTETPEQAALFARAVVASRLKADLDYLGGKKPRSGLIVPT